MKYRILGKTGLLVSEIGLGAEWLERHNEDEIRRVVAACESRCPFGVPVAERMEKARALFL